jgi:hypothetical protein
LSKSEPPKPSSTPTPQVLPSTQNSN